MTNLRKLTTLLLVAAVFSLGSVGCKSWRKDRHEDHPAADHPKKDHPKGDHPKH